MRRTVSLRRGNQGVVLLTLMIALTIGAWAVLGATQVWELERRRDQEQELLSDGMRFLDAVQHFYYAAPPGQPRRLPLSLEELLEDNRYPVPVRHLRRIYTDPITGRPDWVLERSGRGLGVHSASDAKTLKRANFPLALSGFEGKKTYSEWIFTFVPPLRAEAGLPAPGMRTSPKPWTFGTAPSASPKFPPSQADAPKGPAPGFPVNAPAPR